MKKIMRALAGYWRNTDRWLLFLWLGASGLSLLLLAGLYNSGLISSTNRIVTQLGAIFIGLAAAVFMSFLDYHFILRLWKVYLPVCLLGVVLTFFFGQARGGDQAWLILRLGGFSVSIQPSEFLKIAFIMTLTLHIVHVKNSLNSLTNIALLCLHGFAYIMLIQLQDSGTALVFVGIFLVMIFSAGIHWKYMLAAASALVVLLPVLWFFIMTPDQKMRVLTVYNPSLSEAYAYQQLRGRMALSRGGIGGTGIFTGRHLYVPENYNDFIFTFIGEATGLIGALGVIALLVVICMKLLHNSRLAEDDAGRMICIGVFGMIFSQFLINLGMCLSLLPVIGVTLPLISHGGTSVLSLYLGLGLILSVYARGGRGIFSS